VENSVTAAVVEVVVVVEFNVAFARAWKSSNVAWSGGLMAKTIPIFNNKMRLYSDAHQAETYHGRSGCRRIVCSRNIMTQLMTPLPGRSVDRRSLGRLAC